MLSQTRLAAYGSQRYDAFAELIKLHRENGLNATFEQSPVETSAGSEQNAPSHDRHNSGEVAERLNALVLKTSAYKIIS